MEPQPIEESGERIIQENIDIAVESAHYADYEQNFTFEEFYEIVYLKEQIAAGSFSRIALQFPDELLKDAQKVTEHLQEDFQGLIFTLGDTSYGSCCIDEVAAAHLSADLLIHFGPACLSAPSKIPVLYSFGRSKVDLSLFKPFMNELSVNLEPGKKIIVAYDSGYHYLETQFKALPSVEVARLITEQQRSESKEYYRFHGRAFEQDPTLSESMIVFIGSQDSKLLSNLLLSFSHKCEVKFFDPIQGASNPDAVTKILMKRYMLTAKARDAETIGILVGTLSIQYFNEAIKRVKTLIKAADKSFYTMMVGKLNPAKVANFADISVFVLIACPEHSLIDTRDFYQDIITPYELELALDEDLEWEGRVMNDFSGFLKLTEEEREAERQRLAEKAAKRAAAVSAIDDDEDQDDNVYLSLVDGKIKRKNKNHALDSQFETSNQDTESSLVAVSDQKDIVLMENSDMWNKFKSKDYQGLDPAVGQTEVKKAVQGLTGIASSYEGETEH